MIHQTLLLGWLTGLLEITSQAALQRAKGRTNLFRLSEIQRKTFPSFFPLSFIKIVDMFCYPIFSAPHSPYIFVSQIRNKHPKPFVENLKKNGQYRVSSVFGFWVQAVQRLLVLWAERTPVQPLYPSKGNIVAGQQRRRRGPSSVLSVLLTVVLSKLL